MSTLTIVEGQGVGKQGSSDQQAMLLPFITVQNVTFTGTQGSSLALNANTSLIYVVPSANCAIGAIVGSAGSVGSTTGFPLVASTGMFFSVPTGGSIFITAVGVGV